MITVVRWILREVWLFRAL